MSFIRALFKALFFLLGLLVFCAMLGMCAERGSQVGHASPSAEEVDWTKYHVSVRTRVDYLVQSRDCEGLQQEFEVASANSIATLRRTGSSNADLMDYLDASMRHLGCYAKSATPSTPDTGPGSQEADERYLQKRCGPTTDANGEWLAAGAKRRAMCRMKAMLELERARTKPTTKRARNKPKKSATDIDEFLLPDK